MNVLAGAVLSLTGALVVFGSLTGRLGAMAAAVFKPADLNTGYYVRPGVVDPLNTIGETKPPASSGGTTKDVPGFLNSLIPGSVPAPKVAPPPTQLPHPIPGGI